jgi:phage tail sheath protein FI
VVDDIANISWLTGGTNGTALTDDEEVAFASEFSEGILVAHTDKITEAFNQKLEAALYNNGEGMKVAVLTVPLSTAQDTDLAKAFINRQRISRRYHGLYNQTWLSVDDPKGLGPNAKKTIPPIGAVMGYWIQEVVRRGFHRVPASRKKGILGIRGLIGEVTNRVTLTELADLGMNNITGDENGGFFIRSARTPSKEKEFTFVNAVFMSVYFKRTFQNDETIAGLENETDTVAIMRALKNSMQGFALLVYRSSTNGGVESGLASYVKPDGSLTTFNDVCRIVVDESINSIDDVTSGIVKGNFYFMAPSPAERILIGVGLLFTL